MEVNTSSIVQLSIGLYVDENIGANHEVEPVKQSQLDQEVINKGLTASTGGLCNDNDLSTISLTTLDDLLSDHETIINAYIDQSNNALFLETKFNNVKSDSFKQKNKNDIEKCIIDYCLKNVGISFDDTKISSENIIENQLHNINETENNIIVDNNYLDNQHDNNIQVTSPRNIEQPIYIDNKLTVCNICGLTSMDFNQCYRCKKKAENNPKTIPNKTTLSNRQLVIEKNENYYNTIFDNNNNEMNIINNESDAVNCSFINSNNIVTTEATEQSFSVDDNSLTKTTDSIDKSTENNNTVKNNPEDSCPNDKSTENNNTVKNNPEDSCSNDKSTENNNTVKNNLDDSCPNDKSTENNNTVENNPEDSCSNDSSTTSMANIGSTNIDNTDKDNLKSNYSNDLLTTPIINIEQPKFVRGKVAVCNNCVFESIDFNRCYYCEKKIKINPKIKKNTYTHKRKQNMIFNIKNFYNYVQTFDDNLSKINDNNKSNKIAYNSKVNDNVPTRLIPNILKRSAGSVSSNVDNKKMKKTDNISSRRKQNIQYKRLASSFSSSINDEEMNEGVDYVDELVNDDTTSSTDTGSVSPTNAINTTSIITPITKNLETSFTCTVIKIGAHKYKPTYNIIINIYGFIMSISSAKYKYGFITINIDYKDIIKIKIYHDKSMPVLFIYTNEHICSKIISSLSLSKKIQHEKSDNKLIILQLKKLSNDSKNIFKKLSEKIHLFEEINENHAKALLNQS